MPHPFIDADQLWHDHMQMAEIGSTPEGGSNRPALSAQDAEARALLRHWCNHLTFEQDAIGNMFFRRAGRDPEAPAVAFGSHLDTVPTGGRFDGVFGVLSGLAVMRALDVAGIVTQAPLELVNWTNEEGTRFRPAMMGSRVHSGDMPLAQALAVRDEAGISVSEALAQSGQAGTIQPAPRGWACMLEPHIEQGPVLEATGGDIGIVLGTVQARYFQLLITGEPSHAGPTPMDRRRDSLAAAAEIVLIVERIGIAAEPHGRSSASWIDNSPNVRGSNSEVTRLHCDVRHADLAQAGAMQAELVGAIQEIAARRQVRIDVDPYARFGPVQFDSALTNRIREAAQNRQLSTRDMVAVAGHDAVLTARVCPTAMLFIPSVDGITHNPKEYSTPTQLVQGAQVLLDTVLALAG
jgi:N-carbamoyl-L-amino-acid hydrolase